MNFDFFPNRIWFLLSLLFFVIISDRVYQLYLVQRLKRKVSRLKLTPALLNEFIYSFSRELNVNEIFHEIDNSLDNEISDACGIVFYNIDKYSLAYFKNQGHYKPSFLQSKTRLLKIIEKENKDVFSIHKGQSLECILLYRKNKFSIIIIVLHFRVRSFFSLFKK